MLTPNFTTVIYVILTLASFLIEIFVWWLSGEGQIRSWVRRQSGAGLLTKIAPNVRIRAASRQESDTWPMAISFALRETFYGLSERVLRTRLRCSS